MRSRANNAIVVEKPPLRQLCINARTSRPNAFISVNDGAAAAESSGKHDRRRSFSSKTSLYRFPTHHSQYTRRTRCTVSGRLINDCACSKRGPIENSDMTYIIRRFNETPGPTDRVSFVDRRDRSYEQRDNRRFTIRVRFTAQPGNVRVSSSRVPARAKTKYVDDTPTHPHTRSATKRFNATGE